MSVSSSAPSTNTSPSSWGLNDRLVSLMESIYSIIAGLGLRYVVDTVSRHDFKITGTLVGLWEGVILLHFLKKLPKSTDPYLAFAVRLFIDFVVTESVSRLVLVLTWTGMGMILADVAPAIWEDTGFRRVWKRFRRDLYIISESVPTVVFFPPTRTVRFSPSREPSVIAEVEEEEEPDADAHTEPRSADSSTSGGMTEQDNSANIESAFIRRRLPGYFPGMLSDTESILSSVASRDIPLPSTFQRDSERTSRRLSVYPITTALHDDFASETSSQRNEDDDIKLSSSASSQSTVTGPADTTRFTDDIRITDFDTTQITDIPDEEILEEQEPAETKEKVEEIAKKDQYPEEATGPKQANVTLFLPPTPSDSQPPRRRRLPKVDQLRPPSASIPQIPDMPEDLPSEGPSDGWEKIQKEDATETEPPWEQVQREDAVDADKPPLPPPKDWHDVNRLLATTSTNTNDLAGLQETTNTDEYRYSQPPPYFDHVDDHDDIYEDHPSDTKVSGAVAADSSNANTSAIGGREQVDGTLIEKQREAEEKRLEQEVAEKKRQEEAAELQRKKEEAEKRLEEEAVDQKRKEEKRRQDEAAEQRRKDEEAEKTRLEEEAEKTRLEKEASERKRKEEAAEKRRKDEERRLEELKKKLIEEAEKRRKELEAEEAEKRRREQEAEEGEKRRKEQEAESEKRRKELEAEEEEKRRKVLEAEEAEKRRKVLEAEEAEKRRKELEAEEEEKRRKVLEAEEAEKRRKEQEAEKRRKELEAEEEEKRRKVLEAEEAEKRRKVLEAEEAEKRRKVLEAEEAEKRRKVLEAEEAEKRRREQQEAEEAEKIRKEQEAKEAEKKHEKRLDHEAETQHSRQAGNVPTPSTSALPEIQGADVEQSPETIKEEAQANEEGGNDEPDGREQYLMETESVATEQSTIPADVEGRLSRILLTKAQIVEIQSRINDLRAQLDGADEGTRNDLQRAQKALEKLKRKERRGDEVIPPRIGPGLNDTPDHIFFDALGKDDTKTRLLEKLEELLPPEATSLSLTVDYGTKRFLKLQKPAVTEVLTEFNLLDRSTAPGRQTIVSVPPQDFSEWVTGYRALITQPDDTDV